MPQALASGEVFRNRLRVESTETGECPSMEPESITHQLWRQAKAGDQAADERLFSLHANRVLIFIRARLGKLKEKIEAEDVLQDAYLTAHRSFTVGMR